MTSDAIGQTLIGLVSGGAVAALIMWLRFRGKDRAEEAQLIVSARRDDVDTLRSVIAELRDLRAGDRTRMDSLEARVLQLEERERHALTRAAVHEAWDQLAFATLTAQNPHHPPPPPLTLANREHDERVRNEQDARDDRDAQAARDDRDAAAWRADRDARREDRT